MNKTAIQWTDLTWNPLRGCSPVSSGCKHCYAKRIADRFGFEWGKASLIESKLTEPLRRRKPSVIFVNSVSDTFHEAVPDEWIDRMFAVMALCPQHKFLVLTKRARRMREYFAGEAAQRIAELEMLFRFTKSFDCSRYEFDARDADIDWPLPNVGLGVSCEDQKAADERIPDLLATPAAMRFLSVEPMLGAVTLTELQHDREFEVDALRGRTGVYRPLQGECPKLDWVICGGESGPGARPCHPDWVRSLRDQCIASGTPFLFKQWGEFAPAEQVGSRLDSPRRVYVCGAGCVHKLGDNPHGQGLRDTAIMERVSKKAAGRLLDGKIWDQYPEGWA